MSAPVRPCPSCGTPMAYAPQYGRWFCQTCQRFGDAPPAPQPQVYYAPYQPQPRYYVQYQQPQYAAWQGYGYQQPSPPMGQGPWPPGYPQPNPETTKATLMGVLASGRAQDRPVPAGFAHGFLVAQTVFLAALYLSAVTLVVEGAAFDSQSLTVFLVVVFSFWVLLGAVQAALVYNLVKARDSHFKRDRALREALMQHLLARNMASGQAGMDLAALAYMNASAHAEEIQERGAFLWAMIAFVPVANLIAMPVLLYSLTKDLLAHDRRQAFFSYYSGMASARTGLVLRAPDWRRHPERSRGLYVMLAYLTGTLLMYYWYYVTSLDLNSHLASQGSFEDSLSSALQG